MSEAVSHSLDCALSSGVRDVTLGAPDQHRTATATTATTAISSSLNGDADSSAASAEQLQQEEDGEEGSQADVAPFASSLLGKTISSDFLTSGSAPLSGGNSSSNLNSHNSNSSGNFEHGNSETANATTTTTYGTSPEVALQPELVHVEVGPHHFELIKLIGEGGFGKVILVKNVLDDELYAMKVISKELLRKKNHVAYMKSERQILTAVSSPFIVSLHFAFQTESSLFLVMDYLGGGELFNHLRKRGLILESEAQFYFAEMVLAIDALHQINIIHRDLKPENVLLTIDGHISITDFGLAKEIGASDRLTRTLCGTSEYMAPEMIARSGYGKAVDWWSLGVLFFEMLTGKVPFAVKNGNQKELDKKIMTEKFIAPNFLTGSAQTLLRGMLEKDPNKRLGASKATMFQVGGVTLLKRHPFFEDYDWEAAADLAVPPPFRFDASASSSAANFHQEFTTQPLSPYLLFETVASASASAAASPAPGSPVATDLNGEMDGQDPFADFAYTEPDFEVAKEKLVAFEATLAIRQAKALKRRQQQVKADAGKAQQVLEAEKARKFELETKKKQREEAEEEKRRRKAYDEAMAAYRSELATYNLQHGIVSVHIESVLGIQKKVKALRKKLRDIDDLKAKVDQLVANEGFTEASALKRLSPEQRDKLNRRQAVLDDIAEQEEAEDAEVDETVAKLTALGLRASPHSRLYAPPADVATSTSANPTISGSAATATTDSMMGPYDIAAVPILNTLVVRGLPVFLPPLAPEPYKPLAISSSAATSSTSSTATTASSTSAASDVTKTATAAATTTSVTTSEVSGSASKTAWGTATSTTSSSSSSSTSKAATGSVASNSKASSTSTTFTTASTTSAPVADDEWNVVATTKKGKTKR